VLPSDFMNNDQIQSEIGSFIENIDSKEPTQLSINEMYKKFMLILDEEMKSKLISIDNNPKRPGGHKSKAFWNDDLKLLFKDATEAQQEFAKCKSQDKGHKQQIYKDKQSKFDKSFRKAKQNYFRNQEREIESLVKIDGREMWRKIEKMGPPIKQKLIPEEVMVNGRVETNETIILTKWKTDFASLYSGEAPELVQFDELFLKCCKQFEPNPQSHYNVSKLNGPIMKYEVIEATKQAKARKAVSVDLIPNEVLKNENTRDVLVHLYNFCFDYSVTPDLWQKSIISPIYKGKNKDRKDPRSYRPISLISNPCKIFASILNKRLIEFLEENNILMEEQNGFRKGRSCLDHIFVLNSVIGMKLKEKASVFACFVDFSSAFDFVNRDLLLHSLMNIGINGKFLGIVKAYYKGTKSAVRVNAKMTEWFDTHAGVRQGQNDSPTLFRLSCMITFTYSFTYI
jgi:hypothetical protein